MICFLSLDLYVAVVLAFYFNNHWMYVAVAEERLLRQKHQEQHFHGKYHHLYIYIYVSLL